MSDQPSPTNWRVAEPAHAAEIDAAIDGVIAALKRLATTTGDPLVEATATGHVISRLDEWLEVELAGRLSSQEFDENVE